MDEEKQELLIVIGKLYVDVCRLQVALQQQQKMIQDQNALIAQFSQPSSNDV